MIRRKKILVAEELPEFAASIEAMPEDSKIFTDKSMEIADYIFKVMEVKGIYQKDLAMALGETENEIGKWLAGMHNFTLQTLSKIEVVLGENVIIMPVELKATGQAG
jgi:ribosome-binding protein aMBF1 (putative translation factor)